MVEFGILIVYEMDNTRTQNLKIARHYLHVFQKENIWNCTDYTTTQHLRKMVCRVYSKGPNEL